MKMLTTALVGMLLSLASPIASAITYFVERGYSQGTATVTGFIETDGTIGSLAAENITDFELVISSPGIAASPVTATYGPNQTFISGLNTVASATEIYITFTDSLSYFRLQSAEGYYFCIQDANDVCQSGQGGPSSLEAIGPAGNGFAAEIVEYGFGNPVVFATAVPEPETYALFLAGLGLIGILKRRRSH